MPIVSVRAQSLGKEIEREVQGRRRSFDLETLLSRYRARERGTRNDRPARRVQTSLWASPPRNCTDYAW